MKSTMHPSGLAPAKSLSYVQNARLSLPFWLSAVLAVVGAAGCAVSFFLPGLFHLDHPALAGCTRGTALVMLVIALPVMLTAMFLARRGSLRGLVVWAGMLAYLLYNSVYLTFGVSFTPLFLVYVAMLGLSFWATVTLLRCINVAELGAAFNSGTPVRLVAVFLLFPALVFVLTDLASSLTSSIANTIPASIAGTHLPTSPFVIIDLAILTPLYLLSMVWIWQRQARGFVTGAILLTYYVIEVLGIASDQVFGSLADPNSPQLASISAAPFFVLLALVMSIPVVVLLRNLRQPTR